MKRQYRINLSHRQSKLYLKIYTILKRLGNESASMEAMLEHGGLDYVVHDRKMEGYQFRDIELIVARLYEVTEVNELEGQLKKLANRNGGTPIDFRFDSLKSALSGDHGAYRANVGSLRLSKENDADMFKRVSFEAQVINGTYFMLYSNFYLTDSISAKLNEVRLKDSSRGSIGFSFIPGLKKHRLSYSFHHKYASLYQLAFKETTDSAESILQKYLSRPLASIRGIATLYQTQNGPKKIREDFRVNSLGHSPIYDKSEMLFLESESPQLRFYLRTDNIEASPGYPDYPNELTVDLSAILLYQALDSYVARLRKETNKMIHRLAGHFLIERNFKLRQLRKYNNSLVIWRYHIRSLDSLLSSPAWSVYIQWEQYEGTALSRLNKNRNGKPFDYTKTATEILNSNIQACEQLISNALSRVKSELSAKNTSSTTHLSWIVFFVTVVGLIVASATMFTALYPQSTRVWLCKKGFFCNMKYEDTQDTNATRYQHGEQRNH